MMDNVFCAAVKVKEEAATFTVIGTDLLKLPLVAVTVKVNVVAAMVIGVTTWTVVLTPAAPLAFRCNAVGRATYRECQRCIKGPLQRRTRHGSAASLAC